MSLIAKKETKSIIKKGIQFDEDVFENIDTYLLFLGMENTDEARSYVIGESLKFLFIKDKEFQSFKKIKSTEV